MSHLDRLRAKQTRAPYAPAGLDPDQRDLPGATVPVTVRDLLHTPGVRLVPDETRQCVVIELPFDLAEDLVPHTPDPLQAALACHLISNHFEDLP